MKKILSLLFVFSMLSLNAQTPIYNPDADAKNDLAAAIKKAKQENKHVFVQVGGNWCPWCIKFHNFTQENDTIKKLIDDNYITVKINYDRKTNPNQDVLKQLDYPQRFGFPVFVILDGNGKRLNTQNSGYLESCDGKGYNSKYIQSFLKHWSVSALDPSQY